jgi:dihydrofolate reductase
MIRCIAAIDDKKGLANDLGIPWDLPADKQYYRDHTLNSTILMGYRTYAEFAKPMSQRRNLVLAEPDEPVREGFEAVHDLQEFLVNFHEDLWIIGGAGVFSQVMDKADELYLTRVSGDFKCTKFFPVFEHLFQITKRSEDHQENGITFHFEVWRKKAS